MSDRRLTNSELRLQRLEEDESGEEEKGILELFPDEKEAPDEDAPLARDEGHE